MAFLSINVNVFLHKIYDKRIENMILFHRPLKRGEDRLKLSKILFLKEMVKIVIISYKLI